jgi:hypothetical protein
MSLVEAARHGETCNRFCVLVSSSDRGRDIFEIVFKNSDRIWHVCDWSRYAGFTSTYPDLYGFKALAAKAPSDWQGELVDHLESLPNEIEYVMLTFEDALFLSPVDGAKLNAIAELMVRDDLSYVSLLPVRRSLLGLAIEFFRRKLSKYPLRRLSFSEPYYSSVAAAIWKRSYLQSLLERPGLIWDFEHIVTNVPHYAVWEPVIEHDQLVTRGKWGFRARRRLASQGVDFSDPKRGFRTYRSVIRDIREKVVFCLIGFLSFRVRRHLNMVSHRVDFPPMVGGEVSISGPSVAVNKPLNPKDTERK